MEFLLVIFQFWPLLGIQLTRSFASIRISSSDEIMIQQVRKFNTLKEQLIKDWCVQSLSKAARFGTLSVVRKNWKACKGAQPDL